MKKLLFIAGILALVSCQKYDKAILGEWKVKTKFHSGEYKIFEENDSLKGLVLHYNDGTTRYRFDSTRLRYIFKNLEKKEDMYVDGVSGATSKTGNNHNLEIRVKTNDSLKVTTYVAGKPIIEFWTRK